MMRLATNSWPHEGLEDLVFQRLEQVSRLVDLHTDSPNEHTKDILIMLRKLEVALLERLQVQASGLVQV